MFVQVISGGCGVLSQYVAAHVWGLQLRHLLSPSAAAQHAQQIAFLLEESHCRGTMPYSRLQGYLAHLLVAAMQNSSSPTVTRVSSMLQPSDALRSNFTRDVLFVCRLLFLLD